MVDEVVPQEQMEVFNRPREMAEPMPEEMAMEEPQEEISDAAINANDPKIAVATIATFLVDLPPDKVNMMKSFIMRFPLITEAVSQTTQMPPEDLNDLFDAALGNPEANIRILKKLGVEEEFPIQQMPMQEQQPPAQMPMQAQQPPAQMEQGRGLALPQ